MSLNLLELATSFLTPDVIRRASGLVNETPEKTESAMDSVIPTMLAGVLDTASTPSEAVALMQMIMSGGFQEKLFVFGADRSSAGLSGLIADGGPVVSSLFGNRLGAITEHLARSSVIRRSSVASLMSLAAPLVLGLLGRQIQDNGLNGSSLSAALKDERESITKYLPAGLGHLCSWATPAAAKEFTLERPPKRSRTAMWVVPLFVLAALFPLFTWIRTPSAQTRTRLASIDLPGGFELRAAETSMKYALAKFLAQASETQVPKRFVLENLNFPTAAVQPTAESLQTIRDIAAILKAYPDAKVRIEGHTDNTEDPEATRELSQRRAESVKTLLIHNGIDDRRIETAGVGSENPIASNATDEGRRRNRRTELVVVQKSS